VKTLLSIWLNETSCDKKELAIWQDSRLCICRLVILRIAFGHLLTSVCKDWQRSRMQHLRRGSL